MQLDFAANNTDPFAPLIALHHVAVNFGVVAKLVIGDDERHRQMFQGRQDVFVCLNFTWHDVDFVGVQTENLQQQP